MVSKQSNSHDSVANYASSMSVEPISDDDLIRGFLLELGASGRVERTQQIYKDSLVRLSAFARNMGFPPLATMERDHLRHWLSSLYRQGNKPGGVSVRYRAVNRFFKWTVADGERENNPLDNIDPPKIPDTIQPHYTSEDIERVLKSVGKKSEYELRDIAIIITLLDTGVRASELTNMRAEDIDWHARSRSIKVVGKAGKERWVSFGDKCAQAIDRYLRRRHSDTPWLWVTTGGRGPFTVNGLRMMLERRFKDAGVKFRGSHAFRRSFAISFLEGGGSEGDLKNLAGWNSFQMVQRYTKVSANERAVIAHKRNSPGDRLNVR